MATLYNRIGRGYRRQRIPDARIGARVLDALADSAQVLNVGAGAGSYEPQDRPTFAVEPAATMIRQRQRRDNVVQASAVALPVRTNAVAAALAILTIHHWPDREAGLLELRRVASERVVILTWDPESAGFWLTDYFPEILEIDRRIFPPLSALADSLGEITVSNVPVPADCSDGFLGAYWARPDHYLDANVRSGMSTFFKIQGLDAGLRRLSADLASGQWHDTYGSLLADPELDLGYRLVVADLMPMNNTFSPSVSR